MSVKPIPDNYEGVTPYLVVNGAAAALEFYAHAFGAQELFRLGAPGGKVGHAEMMIGKGVIMLADEHPEMGFRSPTTIGGTPVSLLVYFQDVDTVFQRAIAAGAKEQRPLQNQFYGDRSGTLIDPFGHVWTVATHVEDVPPDEMARRAAAWSQNPD